MSEDSLQKDVLAELGDDGIQELAGLLGTDPANAQEVVGSTVSELSGGLQEKAEAAPEDAEEVRQALAEAAQTEPPLEGVATLSGERGGLGGMLSGGLLAGLLSKISQPAATAVARKTGLPAATVARAIEALIPVLLAVLTRRAAKEEPGASGPGAGSAPGAASDPGARDQGAVLGDLLGDVLGGGKK
ncbi:DUF937 domain-containing protein [Streptomyces sp. NPDC051907]|uniref:DUF937 domain-containing protein n=1 Tax=Streptomyces sp. NPDC051907 TaxID=3155284 RepID=UPI003432487E